MIDDRPLAIYYRPLVIDSHDLAINSQALARLFYSIFVIAIPDTFCLVTCYSTYNEFVLIKREVKDGMYNPLSYVLVQMLIQAGHGTRRLHCGYVAVALRLHLVQMLIQAGHGTRRLHCGYVAVALRLHLVRMPIQPVVTVTLRLHPGPEFISNQRAFFRTLPSFGRCPPPNRTLRTLTPDPHAEITPTVTPGS